MSTPPDIISPSVSRMFVSVDLFSWRWVAYIDVDPQRTKTAIPMLQFFTFLLSCVRGIYSPDLHTSVHVQDKNIVVVVVMNTCLLSDQPSPLSIQTSWLKTPASPANTLLDPSLGLQPPSELFASFSPTSLPSGNTLLRVHHSLTHRHTSTRLHTYTHTHRAAENKYTSGDKDS